MFENSGNHLREGTVTMPLAEYDKMIRQLGEYGAMFTLHKTWNDDIEVEINRKMVCAIGRELFARSNYPKEKYLLCNEDKPYAPSMTIAERIIEEEKVEEDEE